MTVSTADLWDEHGDALQSCSVQLRQYGGRTDFTGVISTVRCHRDNALVKAALAEPGNGRVLVVDGVGERDVPVTFGGAEFVPGQTVWADEDGVVASHP